jgi:hypothetical protein
MTDFIYRNSISLIFIEESRLTFVVTSFRWHVSELDDPDPDVFEDCGAEYMFEISYLRFGGGERKGKCVLSDKYLRNLEQATTSFTTTTIDLLHL